MSTTTSNSPSFTRNAAGEQASTSPHATCLDPPLQKASRGNDPFLLRMAELFVFRILWNPRTRPHLSARIAYPFNFLCSSIWRSFRMITGVWKSYFMPNLRSAHFMNSVPTTTPFMPTSLTTFKMSFDSTSPKSRDPFGRLLKFLDSSPSIKVLSIDLGDCLFAYEGL